MSRTLSTAARRALFAQETGEAFLLLLTLAHPDLAAPLRFVHDAVDAVSRGDTYLAFPFDITLPAEREDQPPTARLTIDNVDRQIVQAVRTLTSPPSVTLEVVLASAPDTVEAGPFAFTLRAVEYDALTVSGALAYEDVLSTAFPQHRFTPNHFPGLF